VHVQVEPLERPPPLVCPIRSPFAAAAAQAQARRRPSGEWARSGSPPCAGSLRLGEGGGEGLGLSPSMALAPGALGAAGLGAWASGSLAPLADRAATAALLDAAAAQGHQGFYADPGGGGGGSRSPISPASAAGSRGLLSRGNSWGSSGPARSPGGRVRQPVPCRLPKACHQVRMLVFAWEQ